MPLFRALLLLCFVVFTRSVLHAQEPASLAPLEDRLPGLGAEWEDTDIEAILGHTPPGRRLDLNRADPEQLRAVGLLSERQVQSFLAYRKWAGPLLSFYELQAVPDFDTLLVRRLMELTRISDSQDILRHSPLRLLQDSDKRLNLRWGRVHELSRGYRPKNASASRYLGSPDRLSLRFDLRYGNRAYLGFNMEKDSGEPWFGSPDGKGFDHYGLHLFVRDPAPGISAVAVGDFRVSFGQGLLIHSGFGYGKGAATTAIKRGGHTLSPHRSSAEAGFLRGLGISLELGPKIELAAFASRKMRDGNLIRHDSLGKVITSLGTSGLHRSLSEREDRKVASQFSTGFNFRIRSRRGHLALNLLYDHLSLPLQPRPQPYNRFYFRGKKALNTSVDYAWHAGPVHLFGELARSANGALALLNGLLLGLGRKVDLALLIRHYPPRYQSLWASPFGETGGGRNESGIYLGGEFRPADGWRLSYYVDFWKHPWLRYRVDAPSNGWGAHIRITHIRKRKREAYAEIRMEAKEENPPRDHETSRTLIRKHRWQARLHLQQNLGRGFSLRTRLDAGLVRHGSRGNMYGMCFLQDLLYRPAGGIIAFTARLARYYTPDYALRFYHYENNIMGVFSIPAYYGNGLRWYLNLRFRPLKGLSLEARFAQTFFFDREAIGSGLDTITGARRGAWGAQVRYQF